MGTPLPAYFFFTGVATARLTTWSQRPVEGSTIGSSVVVGFAAAVVVIALATRAGLDDVPPDAKRFVCAGSAGFHPADLNGDSIGLLPRGAFSELMYGVIFDGLGETVALLIG